ncbi:MAG TPA: endo-1,4-beta-xylanase [Kineosporiaceae bacterium]|nr:endo-1,4-beta-xylanase [Kineosporiaceae bacterium]
MQVRSRLFSTGLTIAVTAAVTAALTTTISANATPAAPAAPAAAATSGSRPDPTRDTLRRLAQHTSLRIGTAVDMNALANDVTYRRMVGEQFSTVTPENVMKWEVVEPQRGRYDFSAGDALVRFARAHQQKVRGHTLVWHNQLPGWLTAGTWTPAQLRSILRQHIFAEAGHFRGQIWAWDVVNEAIDDNGKLRDTIWSRALGESYIADAFRWAHQADPKAILFYNDYNIEGINAKSTAVYDLVKRLRAQGVPVQAVGVQGHLSTQYPFPNDMLQNLRRFAALGLDTAVTEADVRSVLPVDPAEVNAQAQGFSLMLQSCLLVRSCISYTLWGFTDKYNWVPGVFKGEGYATPFDENFQPKPAYDTMRRDLALAPSLPYRGIRGHR